jgi:hypothetical protein
MNPNYTNLLSIDTLTTGNSKGKAISALLTPNGETIVVSRFEDSIWDFYPYIPQDNLKAAEKAINWDISLPDGSTLTSNIHANLLKSAKEFIWSLFAAPIEGQRRPSMNTLISKFELLLPLLRWMVLRGFFQFSQLSGKTMDYIPFAGISQIKGRLVSSTTLQTRLYIVECLFHQRGKIADTLTEHPWPNETTASLSGVKRSATYRKPATEVIPDTVANHLARLAVEYIDSKYSHIKTALRQIRNAELARESMHCSTRSKAKTREAMGIPDERDQ